MLSGLTFHYHTNLKVKYLNIKLSILSLIFLETSFSIWPTTHPAAQAGFEFMTYFVQKFCLYSLLLNLLGNTKRFINREPNA